MSEASDLPEVIPLAGSTPEPEPTPEAPAEAVIEAAEEGAEDTDPPEPTPEDPKPKSPVTQLKARVGHLTKTLHGKDAEIAERDARIQAQQAIIDAMKTPGEEERQPAPTAKPAPANFDEAVNERAQQIASEQAFNDACNAVFIKGQQEHGAAFTESVDNLNAAGLTSRNLVDAALATDAAPAVLHHLGQDLDEAARIAALSPVKMGVELTKLAAKLSTPAAKPAISNAPPPITPLGGKASPVLDIYDPNLSDEEYWDRRVKQGAPYVRSPGGRG